MQIKELQRLVKERLDHTGMSARQASLLSVGRADFVRDIKNGSMPSFDKVVSLLDVLGLSVEFNEKPVGLAEQMLRDQKNKRWKEILSMTHTAAESLNKDPLYSDIAAALNLPDEVSGEEILATIAALIARASQADEGADHRREVQDKLAAILQALQIDSVTEPSASYNNVATLNYDFAARGETVPEFKEVAEPLASYQKAIAVNDEPEARGEPGSVTRPVDNVAELAAAAGSGAEALDETVTGQLWFRRGWLDARAIDPAQCVVIGVRGESMEPTLPNGCSILVDRSRTRRLSDHIYVLGTDEGIVVKRLVHRNDGWYLISDHPAWKDRAWPDEGEVIGEVRWMARSL